MPESKDNHIKIDPATLVLIISALILLPLLFAGFSLQ
jgi:preprotein translocase subunit Sec61beta